MNSSRQKRQPLTHTAAKNALINQAAAGYAYLELLEELRGTDCYRAEIKQRINLLQPVLEKYLNIDVGKMWGAGGEQSDKTLYKIIEGWKTIFVHVANLKPEYVPAMAEIMLRMTTDPEKMLDLVNTAFPDEN